jgi:hypothetical protein
MLTALLASAEGSEKSFPLTPLEIGLVGFGVLMLLLFIVTRFDPDR